MVVLYIIEYSKKTPCDSVGIASLPQVGSGTLGTLSGCIVIVNGTLKDENWEGVAWANQRVRLQGSEIPWHVNPRQLYQ